MVKEESKENWQFKIRSCFVTIQCNNIGEAMKIQFQSTLSNETVKLNSRCWFQQPGIRSQTCTDFITVCK